MLAQSPHVGAKLHARTGRCRLGGGEAVIAGGASDGLFETERKISRAFKTAEFADCFNIFRGIAQKSLGLADTNGVKLIHNAPRVVLFEVTAERKSVKPRKLGYFVESKRVAAVLLKKALDP